MGGLSSRQHAWSVRNWSLRTAAGGIALVNTQWGGDGTLETHEGRYWMSYLGGANLGYETPPLSIGMALALDPTSTEGWERLPVPVLRPDDADARAFETGTLFKSFIFRDAAAQAKTIREQADSRVKQLHESCIAQLSAELTPDQAARVSWTRPSTRILDG